MQASVILELDSVSKTYKTGGHGGGVEALRPISLGIERGAFVSFVGPSGCGKTTLLNIVAGLLAPTSGTVWFQGEAVTEPSREVGVMFQRPVLLPWRTVENNVLLPAEVFGLDIDEIRPRIVETLDRVGLSEFTNALPQHLSGGMQQRVALARVLAYRPKILLMDEPFGALDEFTREAMNLELHSLVRQFGITVLFITHNIQEAVFLADQVVVMSSRPGRMAGVVEAPFGRSRDIDLMLEQRFVQRTFEVRELLGHDTSRQDTTDSEGQ